VADDFRHPQTAQARSQTLGFVWHCPPIYSRRLSVILEHTTQLAPALCNPSSPPRALEALNPFTRPLHLPNAVWNIHPSDNVIHVLYQYCRVPKSRPALT
jgi:hypothetical protein